MPLCTEAAEGGAGAFDGAGCLKSLTRAAMPTHFSKDVQTYSLKANAGTKRPTPNAFTCSATAPFALKACPGSPASTSCTPGVDSLRGRPDPAGAWGCCSCRVVKSYTPAYASATVTTWCVGLGPSQLADCMPGCHDVGCCLLTGVITGSSATKCFPTCPPFIRPGTRTSPSALNRGVCCGLARCGAAVLGCGLRCAAEIQLHVPSPPSSAGSCLLDWPIQADMLLCTPPHPPLLRASPLPTAVQVVHFSGAILEGKPQRGCTPGPNNKYARIVAEVRSQEMARTAALPARRWLMQHCTRRSCRTAA